MNDIKPIVVGNTVQSHHQGGNVYSTDGISPTLLCGGHIGIGGSVKIVVFESYGS